MQLVFNVGIARVSWSKKSEWDLFVIMHTTTTTDVYAHSVKWGTVIVITLKYYALMANLLHYICDYYDYYLYIN